MSDKNVPVKKSKIKINCKKKFKKKVFKNDMTEDNNYIKDKQFYFKCSKCKFKSSVRKYVMKHIRIKHGDKKASIITHHSYLKQGKVCHICNERFTRIEYNEHMRLAHSKELPFICGFCSFSGQDKNQIIHHIALKHKTDHYIIHENCSLQNGKPKNFKVNSNLICPICNKVFKTLVCLKTHLTLHSNRKLQCLICEYICNTLYLLKKHHKQRHEGEIKYHNIQVPLSETSKPRVVNNIEVYLNYVKTKYGVRQPKPNKWSRQYKCVYCSYTCSYNSSFNRHLRIHEGKKVYKCGHCDFYAREKYDIKRHSYKLHSNKEVFIDEKKDVQIPYRYDSKKQTLDEKDEATSNHNKEEQQCGLAVGNETQSKIFISSNYHNQTKIKLHSSNKKKQKNQKPLDYETNKFLNPSEIKENANLLEKEMFTPQVNEVKNTQDFQYECALTITVNSHHFDSDIHYFPFDDNLDEVHEINISESSIYNTIPNMKKIESKIEIRKEIVPSVVDTALSSVVLNDDNMSQFKAVGDIQTINLNDDTICINMSENMLDWKQLAMEGDFFSKKISKEKLEVSSISMNSHHPISDYQTSNKFNVNLKKVCLNENLAIFEQTVTNNDQPKSNEEIKSSCNAISMSERKCESDTYKNKDYFNPNEVKGMMKRINNKKVECRKCGVFTTYRAFYKHAKKHFNVKPFKCGYCDYRSIEKSKVKVHNAFCHPIKDCFVIKLDPSSAQFSQINEGNTHPKSETWQSSPGCSDIPANKNSNFVCIYCKKVLKNHSQSLRRHFYSHFKHKAFKCGHCDFTAIGPGEVRGHTISHGMNYPVKIESSGAKLSEEMLRLLHLFMNPSKCNDELLLKETGLIQRSNVI